MNPEMRSSSPGSDSSAIVRMENRHQLVFSGRACLIAQRGLLPVGLPRWHRGEVARSPGARSRKAHIDVRPAHCRPTGNRTTKSEWKSGVEGRGSRMMVSDTGMQVRPEQPFKAIAYDSRRPTYRLRHAESVRPSTSLSSRRVRCASRTSSSSGASRMAVGDLLQRLDRDRGVEVVVQRVEKAVAQDADVELVLDAVGGELRRPRSGRRRRAPSVRARRRRRPRSTR